MKLDLPDREFGGYIFDCDGTLVDSMPLHFRAWTASFEHHSAPWKWTEDEFYANAGVPDRDITMGLNERFGANIDPDSVHDWKVEWYSKHVPDLQPVEAVAELVKQYHSAGQKISVASGSDLSIVEPSLVSIGLRDFFDIIITPARVKRGKPAPDMFLLAAEEMGVPAGECLVFEDGQAGVDAASAAGMDSVFVDSRSLSA